VLILNLGLGCLYWVMVEIGEMGCIGWSLWCPVPCVVCCVFESWVMLWIHQHCLGMVGRLVVGEEV